MPSSRTVVVRRQAVAAATFLLVVGAACRVSAADVRRSTLELSVVGEDGKALPCRIHLADKDGKPQRAPGLPFWRDHFVCDGPVRLQLPPGSYTYAIERGPEYRRQTGKVDLTVEGKVLSLRLKRLSHLARDGWYSGDLHVHRSLDDARLLMRAEDLHVAPVITWWNNRNRWKGREVPDDLLVNFDGNRYYHVMAGEDEREGGALLYFNLPKPLTITGSSREYPSPMKFVAAARRHRGAWIDIEKPFWWDVPVWLASGQVDSIGLANNHMCRSQMYESEAWGRARDAKRLPPPRGNGFWTQEIYYHILNCGLRVPPSAGSASGVLPNPVGYNRVYVQVPVPLTYDRWWNGLKAGRSFVTNGPLLICQANGKFPGHVLTSDEALRVKMEIALTSDDPVSAVEVIHNGRVVETARVPKAATNKIVVERRFDQSGWFLVRAITDNKQTFRFASTAPFYLEIGASKRHISRRSAQFFVDWVKQRMGRVKLDNAQRKQQVLVHHKHALEFWQKKVQAANGK